MENHAEKESKVKVGQKVVESTGKTPTKGHDDVGSVVDFTSVLPPTVDKEFGATSGLDKFGFVEGAPRELWGSPTFDVASTLHHSETVALGLGTVPDVVSAE